MTQLKQSCLNLLLIKVVILTFGLIASNLPSWANTTPPDFDIGQPDRTAEGASRGGCPVTDRPLTALVPTTAGGGRMTQAHPTIWVYVPYTLTATDSVRFSLRNDQGDDIYQTRMTGDRIALGLVSFTPPATMPALEVGKPYTWYLSVYCGELADVPAIASGWIERVELDPTVSTQIEQASPQQRSTLYAENLIWYDALTTLGEERRTHPGDRSLTTSWSNLLRLPSVGLDDFVSDSPTPCCTLTP